MIATLLFSQIIKPLMALSMALSMAMSSSLTGTVGEFEKLALEAATTNPAKTETQIELMVDLESIFTFADEEFPADDIPEVPGIYKDGKINAAATIYTYSDTENAKLAISFGKTLDDGYSIYIDEDGLAVAPALVDVALSGLSVISEETAELYGVYKEYFADNGFYIAWDDALGLSDYGTASEELNELTELINEIITDVTVILTKEDNIESLKKIVMPIYEPIGEYYKQEGSSYIIKLNGVQLIEYSADIMEVMYTEEMANNIYDYFLELADDVDYIKYYELYKTISGDESLEALEIPEGTTNETIAVMVTAYLETYRKDFVDGYLSVYTEEAGMIFDILASGNTAELDEDTAAIVAALHPFLENSYIEESVSKDNGTVISSAKLTIANKDTTFAVLTVTSGISKYNEAIPAAKDVVPFDKRVEFEELDNKLGFKAAREKGIHSVELSWDADMTPDDTVPKIDFPFFNVNYNSSIIESIKKDPAFATLTDEQKELVLGMYEDSDYESKYCSSTAHLIDGSVYLPLRQIMENCGYEVSWDGEARKAYVTVDGNKIEMTGVIVNDRTYVKIRDFEKLGATVDYEEEMYREDAYNDFSKSCYVTITFAK